MPRELDPGDGASIGLDELVDALETPAFDPRDPDSLASFGQLLARLGRNKRFLADIAVEELKQRCAGQSANGYGAQALLLRPATDRYILRANFWPALDDAVVRDSGAAAFLYGMAHDHNFSFLTVGYLGPGYWSDYYEYDGDKVVGLPGEPAGLEFVERSRLREGRVLLYRAHRDVHVQLAPDAFSVSLNILGNAPEQRWRSQYRFDVASNTIAEPLTIVPSEGLVALATHIADGIDLARHLAFRHPIPRMRVTALRALGSALGAVDRALVYELAAADPDPLVSETARRWLAEAA